jgi:predicted nuclease of predicted toxin-antitoxin system
MRLLADECCHGDLVRTLRAAGHDVVSVGEDAPSTIDADVLDLAHAARRILITDDKDFGELAIRLLRPSSGVVLMRTQTIDPDFEARKLIELIDLYGAKLEQMFCVVEDGRFRVRNLGQ